MSIYSDILAGSKYSFEDIEAFDTAEEAQDAIEDTLEFDSVTDALTESTMQGELLGQKEAAMESLMASVSAINRKGRWNDEATVMFNACVESIYIGTNLPAPVISSFEAEGDAGNAAEEKSDGMWTKIKNTIKEWIRQFKEFVKKWWNIAFDSSTRMLRSAEKLVEYVSKSDKTKFTGKFKTIPEGLESSTVAEQLNTWKPYIRKMINNAGDHIPTIQSGANPEKKKEWTFISPKLKLGVKKTDQPYELTYNSKSDLARDVNSLKALFTDGKTALTTISKDIKDGITDVEERIGNASLKSKQEQLKFARKSLISYQKNVTGTFKFYFKTFNLYLKMLWSVAKGGETAAPAPTTESLRWY